MTGCVEELEQIAGGLRFTSPTSFTWFGAPSPQLPSGVRRHIATPIARSHLLFVLRNHLYTHVYRVGFVSRVAPELDAAAVAVASGQTHLAAALSAANLGCGCWDPGWSVRGASGSTLVVHRRGLELWVERDECRASASDPSGRGPSEVALRLPKGSLELSPGYYTALSDEPLPWDAAGALLRLYWNVHPSGAARLMRALTARLNGRGVPFRLKILENAASYNRCDTAVLYLLERHLASAARLLADAREECSQVLRPGVPLFTKRIATGVGLAEDTGDGTSFGQHRCEAVAEGLIRASERGLRSVPERVAVVLEAGAEAGIDFERPHLRQGSRDDYAIRLEAGRPAIGRSARPNASAGDRDAFLAVAARIGERLARSAVWHADRCNWLGVLPQADGGGRLRLAWGALGHDVYEGTSGVAVFLAELHRATGDADTRRAALGAIRHALRFAHERAAPSVGLYTGTLGVALASASVGVLLADDTLVDAAGGLVRRVAGSGRHVGGFDLLSGLAGGVTALLVLHEITSDPLCLDLALRLGDDLVARAERTPAGWSWRADGDGAHPNLTGLSHGAAGAAHALVELYDATGHAPYRAAAALAMGYEDAWLSPAVGNWPDLREEPRRRRPGRAGAFRTQWCHGAPGIALSRLRAHEVLHDDDSRRTAGVALATTMRDTEAATRRASLSYCLCHGLGGNAEVLLEGAALDARGADVARDVGWAGIDAHGAGGVPWSCGIPVPGVETLGLMLGLAGIGHFYLRLADPPAAVPVLLPRRRHFARSLGPRGSTCLEEATP